MSQQKPPAGWYDDPAGSGGRRYWNGRNWTDQVQGGAPAKSSRAPGRSTARERIPDGYMMLNGRRVPLGQMTPSPSDARRAGMSPANRGAVVAALITLGIVLLLVVSSLLATQEPADPSSGGYGPVDDTFLTIEVDSDGGSQLDVRYFDGTAWSHETELEPGWTTDFVPADDTTQVDVQVSASDGEDIASCRILDADGVVLHESRTGTPGGTAFCGWER